MFGIKIFENINLNDEIVSALEFTETHFNKFVYFKF